MTQFKVGDLYTRDQVATSVGMPVERRGGNWNTGYDEWNGEAFIFANVGVAGRTGHDYANQWRNKDLIWYGKSGAKRGQPQIDRLVSNTLPVHLFWRGRDRSPFTYAGLGIAVSVSPDTPVQVVWGFEGYPEPFAASPRSEPGWRRGPPPVLGPMVSVREDRETQVYLMRLEGPADLIIDVPPGHHIIKVGMSSNVSRRNDELNLGFPPGSRVRWRTLRTIQFESAREAYEFEGQCLEDLRSHRFWVGGEFAVVSTETLERLVR